MPLNIFKISMQSVTLAVRANAKCKLLLYIICLVQEYLSRIKHWVEFVILQIGQIFFDVREVEDCLNLNKDKLEQRL